MTPRTTRIRSPGPEPRPRRHARTPRSPDESAARPALFSCLQEIHDDQDHAARRLAREFPQPVTVAEVAASIGAGLAKAALGGKVERPARRHQPPHRGRRATGHRHRQGRRRAGTDPPLDGAPAGLCGQGTVPRGAGDDRPGDRERLLLRLRLQAPVHARGPGGDRAAHGRAGEEGRAGRAPRAAARRGGGALQGPWASTTRPRSSPASRPTRTCRCTAKAASRTCAAARTCRARAS